jgi:hypothetical protein
MRADRSLRALIAAAAAFSLAGLTMLPAEHVHGGRHNADHHAPLVHRHATPHHDHDTTPALDHPDEDDVQWMSTVFVRGKEPAGAKASLATIPFLTVAAPSQQSAERPATYRPSAHDPPGRSSSDLRGPPPPFPPDVI